MHDSILCECCRSPMLERSPEPLCAVCAPWNDAEVIRSWQKPVWQQHLMEDMPEFLDEIGEKLEMGRLPMPDNDESWRTALMAITERDLAPQREIHEVIEEQMQRTRDTLVKRDSPLFMDGHERLHPSSAREKHQCERMSVAQHVMVLQEDGLCIGEHLIQGGPGSLLLRMLTDSLDGVNGFLALHAAMTGSNRSSTDEPQSRIAMALRGMMFMPVGSAKAPMLSVRDHRSRGGQAPPMCDWNSEGYLLGIVGKNSERRVLPLPQDPRVLERFTNTWRGRHGSTAAMRLRAYCLVSGLRIGLGANAATITPHERSFQMLRGIVSSSDEVTASAYGLLVKGTSGVQWLIRPGNGVHNAPYLIHPVRTLDPLGLLSAVCLYDSGHDLPLGDRLSSQTLALLNDKAVATRVQQVAAAINAANSGGGEAYGQAEGERMALDNHMARLQAELERVHNALANIDVRVQLNIEDD